MRGHNRTMIGWDNWGGRAPSTCHHCCEHLLAKWIVGVQWRQWEEQIVGTAVMRKQWDDDGTRQLGGRSPKHIPPPLWAPAHKVDHGCSTTTQGSRRMTTRGTDGGDNNNEETMGWQQDKMTMGEEPQAPATTVVSTCSQGGSWVLNDNLGE